MLPKWTLLRIHADKSLSNLSGIECLVRITFWSLTFQGGKSYSMSYVLILNRKHFPVSFIGRRIAFSVLSCCKSNIYFRLMQIFWREKCILVADLLKKKVLSSRITYSVIDVKVYIQYTWYSVGKKISYLTIWYSISYIFKIRSSSHSGIFWRNMIRSDGNYYSLWW